MKKLWCALIIGGPAVAMLGGCVNVSAPDKPIVINLNINVTAQVVLKLDAEAKKVIDQNSGIF